MRFRLLGTPVRIRLGFLLVISVLGSSLITRGWEHLAVWVGIVAVSVLVHEFGHVIALRRYGADPSVELVWSGGLTSSTLTRPLPMNESITVSLAGPLSGIMLGFFVELLLINVDSGWGGFLREQSWYVNIWWSLLNLLPIYPLDGGHIVQELLSAGNESKRRWIAVLGFGLIIGIVAGAGIAFGLPAKWIILGLFLAVLTNIRFIDITPSQRARRSAKEAHELMVTGDLSKGIRATEKILESEHQSVIGAAHYTTYAWALVQKGRMETLSHLDPTRLVPTHRPFFEAVVYWFRGDLPAAYSLLTHALANSDFTPPKELFEFSFTRIGELDELSNWIFQLPRDQQIIASQRLALATAE